MSAIIQSNSSNDLATYFQGAIIDISYKLY